MNCHTYLIFEFLQSFTVVPFDIVHIQGNNCFHKSRWEALHRTINSDTYLKDQMNVYELLSSCLTSAFSISSHSKKHCYGIDAIMPHGYRVRGQEHS